VPPRAAAAALFIQPLVAALLGVGLLGESVDAGLIVGAALLLGGVALISRGESRR
jgi:drug/metabolite transporter (DMT)-like permease